jgi:hypothetical protein
MSYRPDQLRLNKFYRYILSVFDFSKTVNAMTDSRKNPSVPITVIFLAIFLCVLLRFGSKRSITKESKRHQIDHFLRSDISCCDNTIGHGLEHIGIEALEEELTRAPKQLKRNNNFVTPLVGYILLLLTALKPFVALLYTVASVFATMYRPRMVVSPIMFTE